MRILPRNVTHFWPKSSLRLLLLATLAFVAAQGSARAAAFTVVLNDTSTTNDSATINGGIFQFDQVNAGSGMYTRMFGIQNSPTEEGYNYDGSAKNPFDQKNGSFSPHIDLGDVPVVVMNGKSYLQFLWDANENGSDSFVQMLDFRLYVTRDPSNTNTPILVTDAANLSQLGDLIYAFDGNEDNTLAITIPSGSGYSDMSFNIPLNLFDGYSTKDNVYAYMKFSDGSSGFEELAIIKTGTAYSSLIPEPATVAGGGLILATALFPMFRRPRRMLPA